MTETARTEAFLTIQHYAATNSFGGAAKSVQRARCTAGRLPQIIELARGQEDALAVLGASCVSATLWKLFVLMLLLILTSKRMESVLLKLQVQHTQSIAGCQMSLDPRSVLWLSAHCIQGSNPDSL